VRPLAALVLLGLVAWALWGGARPDAETRIARAEADLRARFVDWRARVERAARAMVALARQHDADERTLFESTRAILERERVDSVAVLDWGNRARCWAGRTFDVNLDNDFYSVRQGVELVDVLVHPAHRVLVAALPAGKEIAVAFLAFDETFPRRRDLAQEVADAAGLARIELRFGSGTVPARSGHAIVIDELVHVTFYPRSDEELAREATAAAAMRWNTLLFVAVLLSAFAAWRRLASRLPESSILRLAFLLTMLAGGRFLLSALGLPALPFFQVASSVHPVWAGPGDVALSALVILVAAVAIARAPLRRRAWLMLAALPACFFLPRAYDNLVRLLVERQDDVVLFDPLHVAPAPGAALLLAALCLLTVALFVFAYTASRWVRRVHRTLLPLPFLLIAAGLLSWQGAWLAVAAALAAWRLRVRGGYPPERAAALVFLAALASFPLLYVAQRDAFVRNVADRAHDLVSHSSRQAIEARLEQAVARATHPMRGVDGRVAEAVARGDDPQHLAFLLWSASQWDPQDPCAVQVWHRDGRLLSNFDFDSPPTALLPAVGETVHAGIHYYSRDIVLRTFVDDRVVGRARFLVPDRWDVLLSDLRPSMFTEPLDFVTRAGSPPLLLAELAPDGTPMRTSEATSAELARPGGALLEHARKRGYASRRMTYRGQQARLVVASGGYSFGALVYAEDWLQQGGLAFAKVLLTYAAVCLLYVIGLFLLRRGRTTFLFRHRVVLFVVALSVPPVLLLAAYDRRVAQKRYETGIAERLERRLDLAETLAHKSNGEIDNLWCTTFAADHLMDINVYRGQELVATSRPGVWDTGLLGRRLSAEAYRALYVEGELDFIGQEYFAEAAGLRAAYRKVRQAGDAEPVVLAAPALDDRRALDRREAEGNALLLAIYLTAATFTAFLAVVFARTLMKPVRQLQVATARVAAGDLGAALPERRQDEFGDLVRSFNRMTRELRDAQDLHVRMEKEAAWAEMARQVAHEIKNPLTPIKLTVQNLLAMLDQDPDEFRVEFRSGAKVILDHIEALHRIAGDFSAYGRFPRGEHVSLDLNELIEEVAALFAASDGATVVVRPAPEPLTVHADRDALRRALVNLVTNARQANAKRVELSVQGEEKAAIIRVEDDGSGIDEQDLAAIWEPAFTTKSSGTGLGLPIVKRVIQDLGGTITIDSARGAYTRVTVWLPRV